jgi:hypothetical protein
VREEEQAEERRLAEVESRILAEVRA